MHPILLPRSSVITNRIIEWCHNRSSHSGRNMTLNEIRRNGFWIISENAAVRGNIYHSVTCRKLSGKLGEQKMTDFLEKRSSDTAPSTYVDMDMFGPFITNEGRKKVKNYGVIFTILSIWAIHLEVVNLIDKDFFITCLRRFFERRGNLRKLRSDKGSNLIGAEKELSKDFLEMDQNKYILAEFV